MSSGKNLEHPTSLRPNDQRAVLDRGLSDEDVAGLQPPVADQTPSLEHEYGGPAVMPVQWPILVGRQANIGHQHLKVIVLRTQQEVLRPPLASSGVEANLALRAVLSTGMEA